MFLFFSKSQFLIALRDIYPLYFVRQYKLSKSADKPKLYTKYTDLCRSLKSCQKTKYLDYITLMQESMSTNPKRFWTFVNSIRNSSSIPSKADD